MNIRRAGVGSGDKGKTVPTPHKGESLGKFVQSWITSKEAKKKFPKKTQREAIAYSEGSKAKLKK
jgi:hypothetical protein